jgi:3-hydroxybutyryl-CoA dehydrogenase
MIQGRSFGLGSAMPIGPPECFAGDPALHCLAMDVGVVGCGTMGSGICETAARSGHRVVFVEPDATHRDAGMGRIEKWLGRAETAGRITGAEREKIRSRITGSLSLDDLAGCALIVESIPEQLDAKRRLFEALDKVAAPEAILATNTSSLPVIELAVSTNRPERVVGIHFFNPAPVMELVELVTTITTAPEVADVAQSFAEGLGKSVVACRDRAGFVVNLLLFPYLNEAVHLLESGFASREDIDAAMRLGAGHPMGPLKLLDLIGLDSCADILESLHRQFATTRFAPSPAFRHLVTAGYLGRKSGRGFYTYEAPESSVTVEDGRSGGGTALPEPSRTIATVGVAGTGTMGAGIAEVAARSGLGVVCWGRSPASADRATKAIQRSVRKAVDRGKLSADDAEVLLGRISCTTDLEAAAACDLVIESVAEDLDTKLALFGELDRLAPPETILSTGTSSLPVVAMASATGRPDRVLGVHFFNPAAVMRLVEVVRTVSTDPQVVADTVVAVRAMGKHPVLCPDRAGFIVNRLLFPFLNDAVRMLEEGYASAEDIDTAMRLGTRHPVGPLALIDLVGLDVTYEILRSLLAEFREPGYAPTPLLEHMVRAGYLGRKTKRGFYTY